MFQMATPMAPARRKLRYPNHPFAVSAPPFAIAPFFIAPVLPGETMKNLSMQARCVTDPILAPLTGWWAEYYFFYVKLTDLYEREEFRQMVTNPAWATTNVTTAQGGTTANAQTYYAGGAGMVNWVELCRRRVVDEFFRDENDTYASHTVTDPSGRVWSLARFVGDSVFDSVQLVDDDTANEINVDRNADTTIHASEVDEAMKLWHQQTMYGLTEMSYEDWLRQFGLSVPVEEANRPELIRYVRDWQYPTNTIDPANGTPRSAVSWTVRERADKSRYFKEPGFLFGVSVTRPKVFYAQQQGSFTSALNTWRDWLSPIVNDKTPWGTMKTLAETVGPLSNIVADTNGYQFDVKDLFLYGEQFTNRLGATDMNSINSLSATLPQTVYPADWATIAALFVTATVPYVRQDGVCNLAIAMNAANTIVDTSPRGMGQSYE